MSPGRSEHHVRSKAIAFDPLRSHATTPEDMLYIDTTLREYDTDDEHDDADSEKRSFRWSRRSSGSPTRTPTRPRRHSRRSPRSSCSPPLSPLIEQSQAEDEAHKEDEETGKPLPPPKDLPHPRFNRLTLNLDKLDFSLPTTPSLMSGGGSGGSSQCSDDSMGESFLESDSEADTPTFAPVKASNKAIPQLDLSWVDAADADADADDLAIEQLREYADMVLLWQRQMV